MLSNKETLTIHLDRSECEDMDLLREIRRLAEKTTDGLGIVFSGEYPVLSELYNTVKGE